MVEEPREAGRDFLIGLESHFEMMKTFENQTQLAWYLIEMYL